MGESRSDILNWINNLLQLNYTKVEQLGTGAAYCQVIDSIYGDILLSRVKFNANQEFQYVQNFKVLQNAFLRHQIPNAIPVERLIKLKFQDNMEFSQWLKKFWDANYHQDQYDAVSRRTGSGVTAVAPPPTFMPISLKKSHDLRTSNESLAKKQGASSADSSTTPSIRVMPGKDSNNPPTEMNKIRELTQVIAELKLTVESMERERDFYFSKLRQLEILIQGDHHPQGFDKSNLLEKIEEILYNADNDPVIA